MGRRRIGVALVCALLFAPSVSFALTREEILQQITALLKQIQTLQAEIAALGATSTRAVPAAVPAAERTRPACPTVTRSLARGAAGDDVLSLQRFLIAEGVLEEGNDSGYFGARTEAAVRAWQRTHEVISAGGAETGFGVVGARTRAAISRVCGRELSPPKTVGAAVSLSLGPEPQSVDARITLNTHAACGAQSYSFSWGDGTPPTELSVPAGACAPQTLTRSHTYSTAGEYTVTVESGGLNVSLPVTITRKPACTIPVFAERDIPAGRVGERYSHVLLTHPIESGSALTLIATGLPRGIALSIATSTATSTPSGVMQTWRIEGVTDSATTSTVRMSAHNACGTASIVFSIPFNQ